MMHGTTSLKLKWRNVSAGRVRAALQFQIVWRTCHRLITVGSYGCITVTCHMYRKRHCLITGGRVRAVYTEQMSLLGCFQWRTEQTSAYQKGLFTVGTYTSKCNLFCKTNPLVVITSTFKQSRPEHSEKNQGSSKCMPCYSVKNFK